MAEPSKDERSVVMTPERAQIIADLFQVAHPGAAAEIGDHVDSVIHGAGDDVPDLGHGTGLSGASVSLQAAQAAAEYIMAAMLMASR